eukprot:scaffold5816_cov267-Pinguiococcus_pyrenoidosus.AAC.1
MWLNRKRFWDQPGTAIAVTEALAKLTNEPFDPETGIERLRDDEVRRAPGSLRPSLSARVDFAMGS